MMTDQDKELRMRLSMLLDSDLDGRDNPRLIDRIEQDNELKSTWERYNLIGDVIRSRNGQLAGADFSARVRESIEKEPTVLAPKVFKDMSKAKPSVLSLGLAASLAVVAVLVGKSVSDHAEVFQTASKAVPEISQVATKSADSSENVAESRFNDYLVMHNETAYMAGSAGMLSYARLVNSHPNH